MLLEALTGVLSHADERCRLAVVAHAPALRVLSEQLGPLASAVDAVGVACLRYQTQLSLV